MANSKFQITDSKMENQMFHEYGSFRVVNFFGIWSLESGMNPEDSA